MNLEFKGRFKVRHFRNEVLLAEYDVKNAVCDAGVNYLWDEFFGVTSPVSQIATWYIGLINNSPTPTLLNADTLASHTGWTEAVPGTAYSGNRKAWNNLTAASSRAKNSASNSSFTMSTTISIYGLLLCSVATGTSGVLWSTGAFPNGVVDCVSSDVLQVTYGISA